MAVVLIQDDQGGGIGAMFGGGSGTPFGARTGNVLTRLTTVLAIIFLVAAFALAWINRTPEAGNVIGRARAERLLGIERSDWWVEAPPPELLTQEQIAPAAAAAAADPAGETPAPAAAAENAAPAAAEEPAPAAAAPADGAAPAQETAAAADES